MGITICRSSALGEVSASIEDLLGIPLKSQRWMVDNSELPFKEYATIGETDLQSGDVINVVHGGVALIDLPDAFELTLTSARHRMDVMTSCSFIQKFKIQTNLQEGWLYYEPWRKSECDKYLFD